MTRSRCKFSVVVPVFEVEPYVAEAIESVIAQTIGFAENIELILVNDGSPDDSESICLHFQSLYPDNITFIRQEHAGVSTARNNGMQHAHGDYVNFLDSDDKWEPDAFEKAWLFIAEHPGIEAVAARMNFFDAIHKPHALDHKFHVDRVVDIRQDPANPQLSGVSVFIRREALAEATFDPRLTLSQDFRFITPIILAAGRYGLLGTTTYWYRRRPDDSSSINRSTRLKTWYLDTPRYCHRELFELSKCEFGSVLPYVQHCVMYDLQWRLRTRDTGVLSADEHAQYKQLLTELLEEIDDDIIVQQKHMFTEFKLYALALKHGMTMAELHHELTLQGTRVLWRDLTVATGKKPRLVIDLLERRGDALLIEGYVTSVLAPEDLAVIFSGRGQRVQATPVDRPKLQKRSLGDVIHQPAGFSALIPLGERVDVRTLVRLRSTERAVEPVFGVGVPLTGAMEASYFRDGEYTVYRSGARIAARKRAGAVWHLKRELKYLAELITEKKQTGEAAGRVVSFLTRSLHRSRKPEDS